MYTHPQEFMGTVNKWSPGKTGLHGTRARSGSEGRKCAHSHCSVGANAREAPQVGEV